MAYCRHCAFEVHQTALNCPKCGGVQDLKPTPSHAEADPHIWYSIVSTVIGAISVLLLLADDSDWTGQDNFSFLLFSAMGLFLGILGLKNNWPSRGLLISGIICSSIAIVVTFLTL